LRRRCRKEWNALHADAEGAVLLPVKWEKHAMPRAAVRPQSAINDQLVDRYEFSAALCLLAAPPLSFAPYANKPAPKA
jgi:hypothetical protein